MLDLGLLLVLLVLESQCATDNRGASSSNAANNLTGGNMVLRLLALDLKRNKKKGN